MIRLLLKNIRPVEIPVTVASRAFYFLMSDLLKVRTSLSDAVQFLEGEVISQLPTSPSLALEGNLRELARAEIAPSIDSMVGLQDFHKARSIQHCVQLASRKLMSVERKHDGATVRFTFVEPIPKTTSPSSPTIMWTGRHME